MVVVLLYLATNPVTSFF